MKRDQRKVALRCAVYTRVSTDSGLEQDFNSLDNQREASEAYIKSQAHEGWNSPRAVQKAVWLWAMREQEEIREGAAGDGIKQALVREWPGAGAVGVKGDDVVRDLGTVVQRARAVRPRRKLHVKDLPGNY